MSQHIGYYNVKYDQFFRLNELATDTVRVSAMMANGELVECWTRTAPPQPAPQPGDLHDAIMDLPIVAWARKWFFDGDRPTKIAGRWPQKYKFKPVTERQIFPDDVPVRHAAAELVAASAQQDRRDAKRYRHLRNDAYKDDRNCSAWLATGSTGTFGECGHSQLDGSAADELIDADIAAFAARKDQDHG